MLLRSLVRFPPHYCYGEVSDLFVIVEKYKSNYCDIVVEISEEDRVYKTYQNTCWSYQKA